MKIFLTGATGYIGGDALYTLYEAHPDWTYAILVRNEEKGDIVKKAFPNIRPVYGDLDSSDLIKEEASKADLVLHTADASDNEGAARSIAAGLAAGHSSSKPGYWLHTGGAGILTYFDTAAKKYGEHSDKYFNDWEGVKELTNLPDEAFHRNVDKMVLESSGEAVKVALICPPTIFGAGRGPGSQRSRQVSALTKFILEHKQTPIAGPGKARWNGIHVADLTHLFLLLAEAAAAGKQSADLWGKDVYYLCESSEFIWSDLAKFAAKKAVELGLLKENPEERSLGQDEAMKVAGFEAVSWGLNSLGKAQRAAKVVGWKATHDVYDAIPVMLKQEAEALK